MKNFFGLLTLMLLSQSIFAAPYIPVQGNSPVTSYEYVRSRAWDSHEFVGNIQIQGGRIYRFDIVLTQEGANPNHYAGVGSIRLEYRMQEGGPILAACSFPIGMEMTAVGNNQVRRQVVSFKLPAALPTDRVPISHGCPNHPMYTDLVNTWGPILFQRRN